jgi:hypothetical protein
MWTKVVIRKCVKQITFTWTEWWIRLSRRGITGIIINSVSLVTLHEIRDTVTINVLHSVKIGRGSRRRCCLWNRNMALTWNEPRKKKKKSEGLGGGAPRGAEATPPTTRCCHISKTRHSILTTRAHGVITRSGLGPQRLQDILFYLPKIFKNCVTFCRELREITKK